MSLVDFRRCYNDWSSFVQKSVDADQGSLLPYVILDHKLTSDSDASTSPLCTVVGLFN